MLDFCKFFSERRLSIQGALQRELLIAPFAPFASTWNNLFEHCISAKFLEMKGYLQGALRKKLVIAPFVQHFKTTTLGKSHS